MATTASLTEQHQLTARHAVLLVADPRLDDVMRLACSITRQASS
jgi:hypothetical protein